MIYAILHGEIIEEYPDDYPFPSCLILCILLNKKPLHVVAGFNDCDNTIWLITAYYPSPEKWEADFKTRKRVDKK
jgi:hypothetical protein